jgi:hypothetical protein
VVFFGELSESFGSVVVVDAEVSVVSAGLAGARANCGGGLLIGGVTLLVTPSGPGGVWRAWYSTSRCWTASRCAIILGRASSFS